MSDPHPTQPPRAIRSFVLRAGRMGSGQQRALAELAPRYVLPFAAQPLAAATVFGRTAALVVEIGFGMGDSTAAIAQASPAIDFVGIEVHPPGVGSLLRKIHAQQLRNLRIVQHDAVDVLRQMVEPASLAGAMLFFPDPWPKKRHHKRRLVQPPFVSLLASRLARGATLHCATDWEPYAQQMLQVLTAEPALVNTTSGFAPRPSYRPLTKFEARGERLGHSTWDLVFRRR
jgi:tRNA (guanine-N7-)-methyltransferase